MSDLFHRLVKTVTSIRTILLKNSYDAYGLRGFADSNLDLYMKGKLGKGKLGKGKLGKGKQEVFTEKMTNKEIVFSGYRKGA
ncbi:TPA: hypothetical protein DDW35_01165 [Candidatus Sumerlaeota bacterium]|nr:hypothetical protein [Candidatus Sumerlaeota bacterium]